MKNVKRILSILLAAMLLMMAMPFAVSAAGTQDDPIDAATKWFGYGVDTPIHRCAACSITVWTPIC